MQDVKTSRDLKDACRRQEFVLLRFWSPSCSHCVSMHKSLMGKLGKDIEAEGVEIVSVNIMEAMHIADFFHIEAVPFLLLVKSMNIVAGLQGRESDKDILEWLKKEVSTRRTT